MARTNRVVLAALVALTVVLASGAFAGTAAADTKLDITGTSLPDSVTQGDSFDLTVSVNGEELENDEVDVSLTLPDGLSCTPAGTQTVILTDNTAEATFECDAEVEGDYTGEITVSASGASSGNDGNPSRTTQTGLEVISPASLTIATSIDSGSVSQGASTTLTAVVNNLGDASTSYTLSLSSADGYSATVADGSESGTVRGGQVRTVSYTVTGDSEGDYDLTMNLTGGNGQSLSETEALSVVASGGGGGGGGGSDTDDGEDSTSDDDGTDGATSDGDDDAEESPRDAVGNGSAATVNTSVVEDAVETTVDGAAPGETVSIDLSNSPVASTTDDDGVGLRSVELSFEERTEFEASVGESAEDAPRLGDDDPTPDADSEGEDGSNAALSYVTVDHGSTDEALETVTFTFDVRLSTLEERDVAADDLSVYRHDGTEWSELDTRVDGRSNGTVTLVAESPGLSTFAVAPASAGSEATATATATATPTPTPDPTATSTSTASPEPSPTTSTDGPGFTVAVGLLALLGTALVAARRD